MLKRSPIACLTLIACLAFSPSLRAESEDASPSLEKAWTFSGFGTLGAVHNQGSGSSFIRDITEPKGATNKGLSWQVDSRVGFQVSLKVSEQLEAVAQVVSRYQWDNNFQPELTWAFLKYTPNEMVDTHIGRIGFDAFIGADTRDVGFSYLWVRPPVEYFGTLAFPYMDGADISFHYPVGSGTARVKLYTGISRQKIPTLTNQTEWAEISGLNAGVVEDMSGSRITGGFVDYQDNHWAARLGKADVKLSKEFPMSMNVDVLGLIRDSANTASDPSVAASLNALASDFSLVGKNISFTSIGLAYEDGPFQTQMAFNHWTSQSLLFPESHSGFISAGYRFGKFTPYAVISAVRSIKSSRADELAARMNVPVSDPIPSMANFMLTTGQNVQHTYSLGVRYDLMANAALKFQMDMIRTRNCSPVNLPVVGADRSCAPPLLWSSVPVSWDGKANVYSAVLDFTF